VAIRQTPDARYRARVSKTNWLAIALLLLGALSSGAAEVMPPKPPGYFNDAAGVVSKQTALQFNEQLAQFERDTSNQIVVAVYPKMETDSSIEDYTQRIAQSWGIGQADRRNGAALFVFVQDRKMFIQVGYGLEGVLPDVTAFDITERNIKPRFRANDYEGGLALGIGLMMKAARGEYTGSGKTVVEKKTRSGQPGGGCSIPILLFIFVIIIMSFMGSRKRGRRGWGYSGGGGPIIFGGGGGWGGGGGGWGGGSSGGGFSGFGGGGGSFGGGGAGSDW
jgi:uncharacterized protein